MTSQYEHLKQRQRSERGHFPDSVGLRIHRALSWLHRAEQCDDGDGQFIFLWIAFNAAYANELNGTSMAESHLFSHFLKRLVELDKNQKLHNIIWQQYTSAIRVLMGNQFVYQPFWHFHNKKSGYENWQEHFIRDKQAAHRALASSNTGTVLAIIFNRLYTLRNQLMHGGATWDSQINRNQVRDANTILSDIVPTIIEILMDNAQAHWGEACYPVVQ